MRILSRRSRTLQRITGRLSDGSDRVVTPYLEVTVEVEDQGRRHVLTFGHVPTDDEVYAAVPAPTDVVPSTHAARRELLLERVKDWTALNDFNTVVQADATATAQQKSRATAARDTAYTRAKQALGGS